MWLPRGQMREHLMPRMGHRPGMVRGATELPRPDSSISSNADAFAVILSTAIVRVQATACLCVVVTRLV